ncbi:phosphonate metabolism protein PhnM [Clostridium thermobutyricum]|uniref:Phosphonate metabolism protein PhnM n=1 Tax=Clostridium thermobutyricum TaxID=29372 RepID=N9WAJ4_9CLOT|nr:phosphonate metabolism protein PhnM [Clostridium thermobutyricum]ENY99924.1 phosphonate metabolism protein PhnM [Clostridium thermobutyricum]
MRYVIKNGKIVTEYGIKEGLSLVINEDKIEGIFIDSYTDKESVVIDAKGGYIAPGFIDIHSDYIELMTSPRPTSVMNFDVGIRETEKVLASCGITTMYHSLSLVKDDEFSKKPIRESKNVKGLLEKINENSLNLIRNKFHGRLEIDNLGQVDNLKEYIKEGKVQLLSIMDHSPGQGQYRDLEIYKNTLKGYRKDISEEEIESILENHKNKEKLTLENIKELIELGRENGISVASHDDDTVEKLNLVKEMGVNISEFPIKLEVAKKAREKGMFTVAGAPNVLLGGSHSGNLSAAEGVLNGYIDILCSDYYPQGMLHSVFILSEKYGLDLCEMFKLVTLNPAKAVGIDKELGSIQKGKKADILIINRDKDGSPIVSKTIVNGKIVSSIGFDLK